ncbi:MAG: helix-turn-helix domain-containing protein [bacterium]|nr:helix-turn-helix domain-containing protein [bacterium]
MEPASSIIQKLGGPSRIAREVGVHRTRVSNWQRPRDVGGTGGLIPQKHIPTLLRLARENGVALAADEFLPPEPAE